MPELRESGEDYLEKILQLEESNKIVRSVDIANALDVSKPSVNRAMGVLKKAGYINQEAYGDISLTPSGRARAEQIYKSHKMLTKFFVDVLKVDQKIAEADACRVEHVLSEQTLEKIYKYMED